MEKAVRVCDREGDGEGDVKGKWSAWDLCSPSPSSLPLPSAGWDNNGSSS